MRYRCLSCQHMWRKFSALDNRNCPECSSPNWASVDTLERAHQLEPSGEGAPRIRENENAKTRYELSQLVEAILAEHNLSVPEGTAEMLVKTIINCHWFKRKPKRQKGKEPSPRERLRAALRHAIKLLKYANTRPSHADSIAKRSERLREALNDADVVLWLAVATPRVYVLELLNATEFDKDTLTSLNRALSAILSDKSGARTGRPRGELSRIVHAGCIAWLRAGRRGGYSWSRSAGLIGRLPDFIRDLVSLCAGPRKYLQLTTNAALYAQLNVAFPYCKRTLKRRAR